MITEKQIQEVLNRIDEQTLIFSTKVLGEEILTNQDKKFLLERGVDISKQLEKYPYYKREYLWGRLSELLGEANAKKVSYKNFMKWVDKRDYRPLSVWENKTYKAALNKTYTHLKGLGINIKNGIKGIYNERQEFIPKEKFEKIVHDEVARGIYDRETSSRVALEIGNKTNDWERDLGRIAETEMNNSYQLGRYHQIIDSDEESLVYKDVYDGACQHCIRLYLTRGLGSRPIVFKPEDLAANGSNIGRKVKDWKATIDGIHPFCRCQLQNLPKGMVWDKENQMFDYPKNYKSKSKLKIKITIGDQIIKV